MQKRIGCCPTQLTSSRAQQPCPKRVLICLNSVKQDTLGCAFSGRRRKRAVADGVAGVGFAQASVWGVGYVSAEAEPIASIQASVSRWLGERRTRQDRAIFSSPDTTNPCVTEGNTQGKTSGGAKSCPTCLLTGVSF